MYYFLAGLTGVMTAVLVVLNGSLGDAFGVYVSTIVIHALGLAALYIVYLAQGRKGLKPRAKLPLFFFTGGIFGIGTAMFTILAFGKISVSAILGLGLLGQCIAAIAVDHFGLFGMPKVAFKKKKLLGIACVAVGIVSIMFY